VAANLAGRPQAVPVSGQVVLATGPAETDGSELRLGAESAAIVRIA